MAVDLQLQLLQSSGGPYTFDIDGIPVIRQERFFKNNANPPELERVTETWEVRNARILGANVETIWDNITTFLDLLDTRTGTRFTGVRIMRDPDGSAAVERTLGPSTYQEFKIDSVEFPEEVIDEIAAGRLRTQVPLNLALSASRVFADSDSITSWEQTVVNTYRNGLHRQEMRTHVETAEGTDATSSTILAFAAIDISSLGNTYTWETNGASGVDYTVNDADENNSRTPTSIDAVSTVQQWGVTIGTPSGGNSVNGPIVIETETRFEDGNQILTKRVSAEGPGALNFVKTNAPSPPYTDYVLVEDTAGRRASGEWVKSSAQDDPEALRTIHVTVTGGGIDEEFVPLSGGFPPKLLRGSRQAWQLTVSTQVRFIGAAPTRADMPLAGKLSSPWRFQRNLSTEDPFPRLSKVKADPSANEWERVSKAVYLSGADDIDMGETASQIAQPTESYFLSELGNDAPVRLPLFGSGIINLGGPQTT